MSNIIPETIEWCKRFFAEYGEELFVGLAVVLTGFLGFGIGRLSTVLARKTPIVIEDMATTSAQAYLAAPGASAAASGAIPAKGQGIVIGTRTTKKYRYSWCPGVSTISEKNKVFFASVEEARAAGYVPVKNCKGLQ